MKFIPYTDELTDALGTQIRIPTSNLEELGVWNAEVESAQKEAVAEARRLSAKAVEIAVYQPPKPMVNATFASAVCYYANFWPWDRDSQTGRPKEPDEPIGAEVMSYQMAIIKAFRSPENGSVKLEDAPFDWLASALKKDGRQCFGGTGAGVIIERLEAASEGIAPVAEESKNGTAKPASRASKRRTTRNSK
tara:strand:- start:564 stop:1139 length:576 start_codon:yes stop_codon:yes gene_type:complete